MAVRRLRNPSLRPHRSQSRTVPTTPTAKPRAAGAAPMYKGEPGYRSELDRDGDGIACDKTR
ncbi:excalibur calcium-binding domain-containing protein [uncultured Actinomyces sp.]|uniref:excalibur calcium-binding domain-containing protein n=1 Tax=uncultured Actinomyces sp. TaxID=249061 RepID=UPI003439A955